jgi:hypothetical protein
VAVAHSREMSYCRATKEDGQAARSANRYADPCLCDTTTETCWRQADPVRRTSGGADHVSQLDQRTHLQVR